MHKRGLCRRAASVRHVRETSKHIFIFFTIPSGSHTSFPYRTLRQHFDGDSLTGAKIAIFDEYLALRSITAGPLRVVKISTVYSTYAMSFSRYQQTPQRYASRL